MAPRTQESLAPKGQGPNREEAEPLAERARSFAFEGFPEKDRFGIFDPALRGFFLLGVAFGAVFGAGLVFDGWGRSTASVALAAAVAAGALALGFVAYRSIWRPPAERELLLRMAREDDEARRKREARAREQAGRP